jgi:SAM-dependent methyltransferase
LPDASFDMVHGQDILHHLPGAPFAREIARILAPDGHAVFSENCANNPLLMFARNRLCGRFGIPKWSTDDEYPLTKQKIAEIGSAFRRTRVEFPEFLFLHFLDAKLFGYRRRPITWACRTFDEAVYRYLPVLRRYSYRQVVRFDGPVSPAIGPST